MALTDTGDQERQRRQSQRTRSIAIGLALGAVVVLFYAATLVRLGPNALKKDGFASPEAQKKATELLEAANCKKKGTC